jgi:hypothetical protein
LRYLLPTLLGFRSFGRNNSLKELPHCLLEFTVIIRIVWTMIALAKPCRFRVWYLAELPGSSWLDGFFFPLNSANLKTPVLWLQQDLVSVQTKESSSCIFSS